MDQGAKTVLQLRTEILGQVFPSGQPENLETAHKQLFQEAFAEIAKFVECEQQDNVNVFSFDRTFLYKRMTVVPCPHGIVDRVCTIADDDWHTAVFYGQDTWAPTFDLAQSSFIAAGIEEVTTELPIAFVPASADYDRAWGRAGGGLWTIQNDKIWLAPWIQSDEKLVIEWRGLKTEWADDDLINPDQDYKKAVKFYFQHAHERDYGDPQKAAAFKVGVMGRDGFGHGGFDEALADLMWQCRERTRVRDPELPSSYHELIVAAMG
ncbi:MAG: hypothetical protein WC655_04130 [Candidatus Hydrogenedentales bacterium]|jgi:hypothetical protein